MTNLEKIASAKHIVLLANEETIANASALYSYVLTLHKKVSLVHKGTISLNSSFLPWFEKLRDKIPSSADLIVVVEPDVLKLYAFFTNQEVKVNKKMATALYAGVLTRYKMFESADVDGMVFALASELINLNADHKMCMKYLKYSESLASFRLRAIMYKNLLLSENATVATVSLCDTDFLASGADTDTAFSIMSELLRLAHVQEVRLVKSDEKNKIIKIMKGDVA